MGPQTIKVHELTATARLSPYAPSSIRPKFVQQIRHGKPFCLKCRQNQRNTHLLCSLEQLLLA